MLSISILGVTYDLTSCILPQTIVPILHKHPKESRVSKATDRTAPTPGGFPPAQGLYDPAHEHDACGVGFVVDMKGRKSHTIVLHALSVLKNLLHRGACGC